MKASEKNRLEAVANWYIDQQLGIDKKMIYYRYSAIKEYLIGPTGLELGPADGEMTKYLLKQLKHLTVVDAAQDLLDLIPSAPNLNKVCSLFEEYHPGLLFNSIILDHVLEHVAQPISLLKGLNSLLYPGGRIIIGVPNGSSFHRLAAVKMGLLSHACELNSRDEELGHKRVYTKPSLFEDIQAAGLRVIASGGVFFKPLSYAQIQAHWTEDMIDGFYELGKDFPDYCAEIYAICEI